MDGLGDAELQWVFMATTKPAVGWPNFRIDCDGKLVRFSEYGKNSEFGWHVDHIVPKALGGSDDLNNLRARN